ncbi:iron-regulated protein [Comamonas aquatica]|jgi:putative iron-regulated protein|uniref:Iron-regulated protein n=1 Tax=Comamonas aquatica TaxID=225991 RepID=A0AA42W1K1_9BURK|nr:MULTISPECIES: imelysin family protein [Comamonas]MDH0898462.1 iron-regulated protein [Comamonas aquatica]MDH1427074.1 iron-regulated protein [Comamonas aquatica]MDH1605553.1 iron-regulated protein [Comamonas aquatica]MDH1617586.1 iron-regulated protein [Comamonas aquatica]MDH1764414.1 iron-regulated protein [Comamonas aquatica]
MYRYLIASALTLGTLAATPASAAQPAAASARPSALQASAVVQHYSTLVYANYSDTIAAAQQMQKAIHAFLAKPSPATQNAARKAWLDAREFYGQTEAFRFYDGPIDNADGPEGQINAWPMDESYVDYVVGDDNAGLINNRKLPITKERLAALNEHDGEENISTGWHAIEFMLWGQDLDDHGPGARPYTDFVDGKKPNADRRRAYLKVVTELLLDDLQSVADQWKPGVKNNFRAAFDQGGDESLRKVFIGLGSLSRGELAGERLEVAMASRDQEDEHSCFSDNTHRDAVTNAQGIQNVWLGHYQRRNGTVLQGPGLRDWVAAQDPVIAEKTSLQIAKSVASAQAIPAPFDQAIQGARDSAARAKIQATIDSLTQQSKDLVDAAKAVGFEQLNLVEP